MKYFSDKWISCVLLAVMMFLTVASNQNLKQVRAAHSEGTVSSMQSAQEARAANVSRSQTGMIQVADVGLPRTKADPATGSPISVMDAPIGETVTRNGLIYEYQGIYAKLIGCTAAAKNQKKITIPDNIVVDDIYYEVRIIDCNALEYCTGLQKLVIGKNVRQIRYNAFHGDRSLERVKFLGKKLKQVGQNSFKDTGDMPVFRVPGAVKARYTRLIRQGSPSHWSLYRRLR